MALDSFSKSAGEPLMIGSINRFSKIDLSILQLAIAEMLSDLNIPDKVSINEAIDLAKMYCEEKTPKFINGILGSVVNEIKEK